MQITTSGISNPILFNKKMEDFDEKIPCNCRRPINFYNDKIRYRTMIILYISDLIFFIIRLSLVSHDISKGLSDRMPFLIPIIIFDLIASVPIIIANILYLIMQYCVESLNQNKCSLKCPWHFATLTCFRFHCHKDRPQAILLMRIIIIGCSFLLKFMCFIIAAACSSRFQSECTAYTVIAAFALVVSIWIIVIEFINYFRLWEYNPTDTRNRSSNQTSSANFDEFIEKTHRRHLGFVHYGLLNDRNSTGYGQSRCNEGLECKSKSLHHYLFYHSLVDDPNIDVSKITDEKRTSFIAFYQTTKAGALKIAQTGFPFRESRRRDIKATDFLHLDESISFKRSCKGTQSQDKATICARLSLGKLERVKTVETEAQLNIDDDFAYNDGKYDTIYVRKTCRLYLRLADQIESWIITINEKVELNDILDTGPFLPCI